MIPYIDKYKGFVVIWFYFCIGQIDLLETSMDKFKSLLADAKHVVVLTGAGISAESGIPTFRGSGGLWRRYQATDLATLDAFKRSPSLVWEFYHYRRDIVLKSKPNKAHIALTEFQKRLAEQGRKVSVITQNIDGLHMMAGTKDVIEMHGSLFETKCMKCDHVEVNRDHPIVEALRGRGAPDVNDPKPIPEELLPRCKQPNCGGLLRPNVVWFGELLNISVVSKIEDLLEEADVGLVIGSSSKVHPAAAYVLRLESRGVPVAEFNIEKTHYTSKFSFYFEGPCSQTLPEALSV